MTRKAKGGSPTKPVAFITEFVGLDKLKPHPKNYRSHSDAQLDHLVESIRKNGFYRNVVIAKDGTILAGHGVVAASRKMNFASIPVVRMSIGPNDVRALKVLAGDNEIGSLASINYTALTEILNGLGGDLLGTGYTDKTLAELIATTLPPDAPAAFPEVDETTETQHECPKCGYRWN